MKDTLIVYRDWWEAIKSLPQEQQLATFHAICAYAFEGTAPDDPMVAAVTMLMRSAIDRNELKWNEIRKKRREAGRRGAQVTNHQRNEACETSKAANADTCRQLAANADIRRQDPASAANSAVNVNVNVNDNVNVNGNVNVNNNKSIRGQAAFAPPTVDDVRQYSESKGYKIDAEAFIAFYESNGWKVGRNPMKNWRSAVITWSRREQLVKRPAPPRKAIPEPDEW